MTTKLKSKQHKTDRALLLTVKIRRVKPPKAKKLTKHAFTWEKVK